ncbi:MAG: YkgJ family cysteine cluster protein [Thermoplasmatota archaeon]
MSLPVFVPPADGVFSCTLCGKCCQTLKEHAGAPSWPTSFDRLARLGFYGLRTERGLQVWSWERARMDDAARERGLSIDWVPSLVAIDDGGAGTRDSAGVTAGRAIALVYEEDHMECPLVVKGDEPDTWLCGSYDARPTVCRAFPVILRGEEAAYSSKCPVSFMPSEAGRAGYAQTYGESFLAAEKGALATKRVRDAFAFLETAGVVRLARHLDREQVARRLARGPVVDLMAFVRETGALAPEFFADP